MTSPTLQPLDDRPPRCHHCGFDLTGLPSPDGAAVTCPECGEPVRLELAYSTPRERVAEWLQEPAQPTPARIALTTLVMLAAASVSLTVLLAVLYLLSTILSPPAAP
jgi:hypothetical protein